MDSTAEPTWAALSWRRRKDVLTCKYRNVKKNKKKNYTACSWNNKWIHSSSATLNISAFKITAHPSSHCWSQKQSSSLTSVKEEGSADHLRYHLKEFKTNTRSICIRPWEVFWYETVRCSSAHASNQTAWLNPGADPLLHEGFAAHVCERILI